MDNTNQTNPEASGKAEKQGGEVTEKPGKKESKKPELRILLWGLTGHGRSTVGNAILGEGVFTIGNTAQSTTDTCQREEREFDGKTLVVVDTPGVFHTGKNEEGWANDIQDSMEAVRPGPHVILLVLKQQRFSREHFKVLEIFRNVFPGAATHTIIVVTHADQQAREFLTMEPFSQQVGNFYLFNPHVDDLVRMITALVNRNNTPYQRMNQGDLVEIIRGVREHQETPEQLLLNLISDFLSNNFPILKRFFDFLELVAN